MASVTLAESAKLAQDELIAGVIENVVTVNPSFEALPFRGIEGNALAYNRENVLGDIDVEGVGDTIGAKAAATFTQVTSPLTTIIGDAEVNGLIQATRSGKTDQTATQIASKAKSAGRKYQDMFINGSGSSNEFTGLLNLVSGGQTFDGGTNGGALTLEFLDQLIDMVTDKDGEVDYLMMHSRTHRELKTLLRAAPGGSIAEWKDLPNGRRILMYGTIPVFRNDWIPIDQTQGTASDATSIFAGTFDDGSGMHGISGLTAENAAGLMVENVGVHQSRDEYIWRVKWYCGLALYSNLGLAMLEGIIPPS